MGAAVTVLDTMRKAFAESRRRELLERFAAELAHLEHVDRVRPAADRPYLVFSEANFRGLAERRADRGEVDCADRLLVAVAALLELRLEDRSRADDDEADDAARAALVRVGAEVLRWMEALDAPGEK